MYKNLDHPIQYVKGVGPKLSQYLEKLGVKTVRDCLYFFPPRYADRRFLPTIFSLQPHKKQGVVGKIKTLEHQRTRNYKDIIKGTIYDHSGTLSVIWFNQPYLMRVLKNNMSIYVEGKVAGNSFFSNGKEMVVYNVEILNSERDPLAVGRILPKYSLTEGLYQRRLRSIMDNVFKNYFSSIFDFYPANLKGEFKLFDLNEAILNLHFPKDRKSFHFAKRRIIFDEFFFIQLASALKQKFVKSFAGINFSVDGELVERFEKNLPFSLTTDQKKVIDEIRHDLNSPRPMNRLLQGDVGCGKTIVAAYASAITVQNHYRVVIMAPTEILAEQHYRKFLGYFEALGVKVGILVGGISKREQIEKLIEESQIIIGTHALIQDDVIIPQLGLVIIDEQHKFGVMQRQNLRQKSGDEQKMPHLLVMTATPIPRTLALTCYGDLDRSTIYMLPPGRIPVKTFFFSAAEKGKVYDFVCEHLRKGFQAYLVYPLVEESEKLELEAATKKAEEFQENEFHDFKVGLIHGQMPKAEKDEVMKKFQERKIDVLVATTVVEVGLDVPNANCMVIEHAQRFGLSTLHQLRGRIGRGGEQSFCYLIGYPQTQTSKMRLAAMVNKSDGFEIAQMDLKIRGPGEFLGVRQSGIPEFAVANLIRDEEILKEARHAAFRLVNDDPALRLPQHHGLKAELVRRCKNFLTPGLLD